MSDFTLYILTAICLVFVIEGLLYALFPGAVRAMIAMALTLEEKKLRLFGITMVLSGFSLIWILQSFSGG